MPTTYHVAKNGSDRNAGTAEKPFLTINAAARIALPGDTVIVHEGEYREWVNPREGGRSNTRRITYCAAKGEKVVIKGSERITSWENVEAGIWKAVIPNAVFGGYNPYAEVISGDWLVYKPNRMHPGDVYLNGMSFYEAESYDELKNPAVRTEVMDHWDRLMVPVKNPEQTKYLWYAKADDETTTIWANFHSADPNAELVEVNVRKCCFYPEATGVNYITVRGFEMAHAATPWSPPTADQPGLIGAHWSRGWIIENNIIHDSKCSVISIGKEVSTGHNFRTVRGDKPGYQYQLESVFAARKIGWSKENIGSHIIRNNEIYDCGQNGIVGHLGCVFSEIYNNHIYNIALKREFYGHEIAGIKLHAAIDVHIHHNHIHDCSLGTWMDWQAQGTRISQNVYHSNVRDLFIEVSHGPHVVDHNILGSHYSLDNHAQGGAYINNLFAGHIIVKKMLNRATPYHAPHSTDVAGYAMVYSGDDRFFGNLFIGGRSAAPVGTSIYNGYTASLEEYIARVAAKGPDDLELFEQEEQPVYVNHNAYFTGASAYDREAEKLEQPELDAEFALERAADGLYLCCTLPPEFDAFTAPVATTATLPRTRIVDADFDTHEGALLVLDTDLLDAAAGGAAAAGPIASLKAGKNRIKVASFAP